MSAAERVGGDYRMPSLGADMRGGRVVEWLVRAGDSVRRGDVVGVVDTDKGAIEMEIWEDAVIEEIVVGPGQRAAVGDVLLRLRPPVEQPPAAAPAREVTGEKHVRASPAARRRASERGVDLRAVRGSGPDGAVVLADVKRLERRDEPAVGRPSPSGKAHATPLARRVADSLGIDVEALEGHGPGGLVTRADVEAARGEERPAIPAAPSPSSEREAQPPENGGARAMREAIAAAMSRSKREIPHYYLSTTTSVRRALEWLTEENRGRAPADRLLAVSLFVKAVAVALHGVPELNGHWIEGAFRRSPAVHPGVAVSLRGGGLVAPAVRDADQLGLAELSASIVDVVNRARSGRLRSSEMSDATITVSSMGDRGVDTLFGVIHPPQVALVGVGRIAERPWAEDGMLGVHPVVSLTLSADHRASDGHRGGVFLEAVAELLQHPEEL